MKIRITSYKTFGVKKFMVIANDDNFALYNVFGFGLWIAKNREYAKYLGRS